MALQKTPVSWPITGGIKTKDAPIMLQPPGQAFLDNVRQERLNEWRTRPGLDQNNLDNLPGGNVPVIATEAPWGGLVGLTRQTDNTPSGRIYNSTSVPRWSTPIERNLGGLLAQSCSQLTPGIWARTALGPTSGDCQSQATAEGGGYKLSAWSTIGFGLTVALTTVAGASILNYPQFDSSGIRPRCVYSSVANVLALFYTDGAGNIIAARWDSTSGAPLAGATLSTNGTHSATCYLDAIWYGGATITVAFKDTVGGLRIYEYNPSTNTGTEYPQAQNCANAMSLLPDPDGSGIRMVAVGSNVPEVRVLRLNNVGVIQTNQVADTLDPVQIAGCAYTNGTEWMIVYGPTIAGEMPWVTQRRGGVTTAPQQLGPATAANASFALASNAWREPGTDTMRYMLVVNGASTQTDPQGTFLEMAVNFVRENSNDVNRWTEPQARLLPLNSYSVPTGVGQQRATLTQVQRTATDRYVLALVRQTGFNIPADNSSGATYAVDSWTVQYMNSTTYTGQRQGSGCQTQQCAYLPVGSLLQTATGALLCSHGGSALPFQPTLTPAGGGSLTPNAAYSYIVTVEMTDEQGNIWASRSSVAGTITAASMGANTKITVVATATPLENICRRRTLKIWRTAGNGSQYFLVHQVTDTVLNTVSVTFVDTFADTTLSQAISSEQQGSITPAATHIVEWNRRLWFIDRDFPTRVRFSKPITIGLSPQFPANFYVDTDDGLGPGTELAAMDDRLVLFKGRGVYVASGDGPDNLGNGTYPAFTRISSEAGNIVGGPIVSMGGEVYFTSAGGVFRVTRSQEITFVGSPIDGYLSMPLVNSPETVIGMVVSPAKNEVRVQTTHYRFVHDRVFDVWIRDTGAFLDGTVVMTKMLANATQCLITSGGFLWTEQADSTAPLDAGVPYQGLIRSPWIRPSGVGGWIRLYRARVEGIVTAIGTVTGAELDIMFDDDETIQETFSPAVNLGASTGLMRGEARPQRQKCTSFALQLKFPLGDASVRLEEWWVVVAAKMGAPPQLQETRWPSNGTVPPPIIPPASLIPTPLASTKPVLLTGNLLGSVTNNQRDLSLQFVNTVLAAGGHVVQSYNANGVLPSPGVNTWLTYADIKGSGGGGTGFSWIVIGNSVNSAQICLYCTVSGGWCEWQLAFAPGGGFTGGTTLARPTAPGEVNDNGVSVYPEFLGTGPAGNPQFYACVWVAPDFSYVRATWHYAGKLKSMWNFDLLRNAPAGWTKNGVLGQFHWGNTDYTVTGNRATISAFRTNWGSGGTFKRITAPAPDTSVDVDGSMHAIGSNALPDAFATPNVFSNQYIWTPGLGYSVSSGATSVKGYWGNSTDMWFTVAGVFNDGDTAGDNFDFIVFNQLMLQWGIGAVGSRLGGSSTNYPTARWYGRSSL